MFFNFANERTPLSEAVGHYPPLVVCLLASLFHEPKKIFRRSAATSTRSGGDDSRRLGERAVLGVEGGG